MLASVAPVFLPSQTHTHPRPSYLLKINDSGAPPITSGETFVCVSPLILDHCCRLNTVPSCVLSRFSHVQLCATLWTVARQAPLSMGFPRQEYWSGLPCPPPGDLPHPWMEPISPAVAAPLSHWESPMSLQIGPNSSTRVTLYGKRNIVDMIKLRF